MTTRYYRCEVSRPVASIVIRELIDLKIPLQTEYLKNGIIIVVPGAYADTLAKVCDNAQFTVDSAQGVRHG